MDQLFMSVLFMNLKPFEVVLSLYTSINLRLGMVILCLVEHMGMFSILNAIMFNSRSIQLLESKHEDLIYILNLVAYQFC